MRDRAEQLGEQAWAALQQLVRTRLARKPGAHLIESSLEQVELRLRLVLRPDATEPKDFARGVVRAIDEILDDAIERAAAFRPGHAWCHRCESASCEHSAPPSSRHVFRSYAPTGTPRWEDFAQLCLERKHPEVDRLFDQPPALLTLIDGKAELHGGMLNAFRVGSYELLGQVTAGFFPASRRAEQGRSVVALTAQAAASRGRYGTRLGLNLIGRTPAGEPLDLLWESQSDLPWRRAIRWAQSALGAAGAGSAGRGRRVAPRALEPRVQRILLGLARRLERQRRAQGRRTRHAEERHASGERPTRKALEDARRARGESLFLDERSGTLVVLGERGRTHFFTTAGQLVSSVRYSRDAIQRKIKLRFWLPVGSDELRAFRSTLGD